VSAFLFRLRALWHGKRGCLPLPCGALSIPTDPKFGSLNLAAAVQLIAYDWREALGGFGVEQAATPERGAGRRRRQVAGMLGALGAGA
jgi:tRNA C32,U32 (ribose-2'-O)-methylase TrmJ